MAESLPPPLRDVELFVDVPAAGPDRSLPPWRRFPLSLPSLDAMEGADVGAVLPAVEERASDWLVVERPLAKLRAS